MDYKEMYLKLFRATEKAAEILITAQQECEEMYINAPEPKFKVINTNGEPIMQTEDE